MKTLDDRKLVRTLLLTMTLLTAAIGCLLVGISVTNRQQIQSVVYLFYWTLAMAGAFTPFGHTFEGAFTGAFVALFKYLL